MSARNVRKDVARNRARIIDAARIAFRQHGVSAPVATIARIAGVGTATLYRHFPSRDDLLMAMFGDQARHRTSVLDDAVADPDPWRGFVRSLETVVEVEIENPGLSEAIVSQRHAVPLYEELRVHAMAVLDALAARLRDGGIVDEEFRVADILLILAALKGVTDAAGENALPQARRLIHHLAQGIRRQ